jgi:hypothetical protein
LQPDILAKQDRLLEEEQLVVYNLVCYCAHLWRLRVLLHWLLVSLWIPCCCCCCAGLQGAWAPHALEACAFSAKERDVRREGTPLKIENCCVCSCDCCWGFAPQYKGNKQHHASEASSSSAKKTKQSTEQQRSQNKLNIEL